MSCSWITVIGIGDDGLDGLPKSHINLINEAEVLVGGKRHHDKVRNTNAEALDWAQGFEIEFFVENSARAAGDIEEDVELV